MTQQEEKENILIVDDTPENLTVLREMLADQGYRVRPALNGEIALKAVRTNLPDLILLDILMPEMDGYEVCNILKSSEATRQVPIIFISALTEKENILRAFQAGGVDYISKPFQAEEVIARVRTHLELQRVIREREESRNIMQIILESIENTIITVDSQLRVINCNKPLDKICGIKGGIESFQNSLQKGQGPCAQTLLQTLEKGEPLKEIRVECSCNGATNRILVLNTALLKGQKNAPVGAVLVIRDITRLATLEKRLLDKHRFRNIIGSSEKMQQIYSLLERTADLDVNVLIYGESGTGKELIAEAVHSSGSKADGPLVKVNCAALSDSLLESELFGHVRGAFTGAVRDRAGRCQAAEGGTLFLDEIGDITPRFQAKLLRFLEQKEYERIGESETRKADVRVVAATNQDLQEKVETREFREDLLFRLKGVLIELPPLRERGEDIPLLVSHFLEISRNSLNKNIEGLDDEVSRIFLEYPWPGNIRELKSTIHYGCALSNGEIIQKKDLPPEIISAEELTKLARRKTDTTPKKAEEQSTKERILAMLEKTDWNKAKTARLLRISRATLYTKLLKYNIENRPD